MELVNRNFITGGLPLNSNDFINPDNIRLKKSRLLAALENINKVHEEKMGSIVDRSYEYNNQAVDSTIGLVSQEAMEENTQMDEYINYDYRSDLNLEDAVNQSLYSTDQTPVDNNYVQTVNTFDQPNDVYNQPSVFDQPANAFNQQPSVFDQPNDVYADNNQGTAFEPLDFPADNSNQQDEFSDFNSNDFPSQEESIQQVNYDQGDPMLVLNEQEVGKRGKGKGKKGGSKSSSADAGKGKGVAWLAYILFFIPLLLNGKNSFVRHHANEGLCINIFDAIGIGLYFAGDKLTHDNAWINFALMVAMVSGAVIVALTTITKLVMILMSFAGKEPKNPFIKFNIIK